MANLVADGTLRVVLGALDAMTPDSRQAQVNAAVSATVATLAQRTGLPLATVVAAVKELLRRDLVEIVPVESIEIHVAAKESEGA